MSWGRDLGRLDGGRRGKNYPVTAVGAGIIVHRAINYESRSITSHDSILSAFVGALELLASQQREKN